MRLQAYKLLSLGYEAIWMHALGLPVMIHASWGRLAPHEASRGAPIPKLVHNCISLEIRMAVEH